MIGVVHRQQMPTLSGVGSGVLLGLAASLLAALEPVEFALAVTLPPAAVVGWRHPQVVLVAFVCAGAFKQILPVPVDLTVALAIAVATLVARSVAHDGVPPFRAGVGLFIGLVAVVLVGVALPGATPYGIEKAARFATLSLLAFVGGGTLVRSEKDLLRVMDAAVAIGLIMSGYAVASGGDVEASGRFTALGSNTIALGRAAGIAAVGCLVRVLWDRRSLWWSIPTSLVTLWAMAGSGSRGPGTAVAVVSIALMVCRMRTPGAGHVRLAVAVAGSAALVFATWELLPQASSHRLAGLFTEKTQVTLGTRASLYQAAADLSASRPLFGSGTGAFASVSGGLNYPHNIALELLGENGVLGLALMGLVVAQSVMMAWVGAGRCPGPARDFLLAALCIALLNAMVSGDLNDNRLLYVLCGAALVGRREKWDRGTRGGQRTSMAARG